MASKKHWDMIYDKTNPFSLPQDIAKQVKMIAHSQGNGQDLDRMQYLWIYVTPVESDFVNGAERQEQCLAADDWLNILDEAATLGTECVVISTGEGSSDHPSPGMYRGQESQMLVGARIQQLSPRARHGS